MGFLPISGMIRFAYLKVINLLSYFEDAGERDVLFESLLQEMVNETKKRGAVVYFLMLPDQKIYDWSRIYKYLPDLYNKRVNHLRSLGFNIVDVRKILRENRVPGDKLFMQDGQHYTPVANKLIALALRSIIEDDVEKTIF